MYPVSNTFNNKILPPSREEREVFGKIQVDYTDPFIDQSIDVFVSERANISIPDQVSDGATEPLGKIASLDGSWILDGTYILADNKSQIGWWGSQLSNASALFVDPFPYLEIRFKPRPIHRLKVTGDSKRKEYPVNFMIILYGEGEDIFYIEEVTNNTEITWQKELTHPITQVERMGLVITKWSHPNRQVKIFEFFTSVQEVYFDKDIIKIDFLEERGVGNGGLPVGDITSNEITIQLKNSSKKFSAGNTQSPLYNLLKPNRRIKVWLGVEVEDGNKEFVPLGTFWSGDWDAPEEGLIAKVVGRDRFKFLEETTYFRENARTNLSLYDLALDILTDAGLTSEEFWIDTSLKDYIIPYVKMEPQSHREALRKVINACLGQAYCNRDNITRVESTKQAEDIYDINTSENANISYPNQLTDEIENPDALFATLDGAWILNGDFVLAPTTESLQMGWYGKQLSDASGMFISPYPKVTLTFLSKAIEMFKIAGDSLKEEYPVDFIIRVYDGTNNLLSEQNVIGNNKVVTFVSIPENPTNATKAELEILKWSHSGRQVKILEFKDVAYKLNITLTDYFKKNNPAKYSELANYIEVMAQPVDVNGNKLDEIKIIVRDDESIKGNGIKTFKFPQNPLIQTQELAQEIANSLLNEFKNPRRNLDLEWRGHPALLLGNIVTVNDNKEKNDYKVIRQEFEYAKYLRSKITGRRI